MSEANWARFLAAEVTPRFPDGFTVLDAKGQWRDAGRHENLHGAQQGRDDRMPPGADNDANGCRDVIEAYKTRFKQQSVGLIVRPACVSF